MTKLVVAALVVLAAAAAADAVRTRADDRPAAAPAETERETRETTFVLGEARGFVGDGRYLHTRVLRDGREYLSREQIERAFPVAVEGPLDITELAVAPDGTLVLEVYRFPRGERVRSALQFWRGKKLEAAFAVPPGSFGGGLAFNRDGSLVATFRYDGELGGVFDRRGRLVSSTLPDSFLFLG